ncbi:hypothetical protein ACQKWADRAFT_48882 [Trichoderma austrokoningii]
MGDIVQGSSDEASDTGSDASRTLSVDGSDAGNDVSHTDFNPDINEIRDEYLPRNRRAAWEELLQEWRKESRHDWENCQRNTNDDTSDPSAADDNAALQNSSLETTVFLGYPKTTEQMQNYWRMLGWSINDTMWLGNQHQIEKGSTLELPDGGQETWFLLSSSDHGIISGASVYHRQALLRTTKGVKLARASVISQVVTQLEFRLCGYTAHFLKLLAEQMDSREGQERIDFSILYSGPNTRLFQRCGWRPLHAKQLRITLRNVQRNALDDYFAQYPQYLPYMKYLTSWDEFFQWHRDYKGLSMMAMSDVKHPTAHAQIVLSSSLVSWHLERDMARLYILGERDPSFNAKELFAGASFHDVVSKTTVLAYWVHDFQKQRLYLGCMDVRRRDSLDGGIRMVLSMAVSEAFRYGFGEVILWDPTAPTVLQAERIADEIGPGVSASWEDRSEMIPCFRWRGGESKDVIWTESGYFATGV